MRRIIMMLTMAAAVAAVAVMSAIPALAVTVGPFTPTSIERTGGLHFVGQPTVTATKDGTAFLSTSGEVAGAGTQATATLSATAEVTRGCITRGGGEPKGLQTTQEQVLGSQTFETRQGRGTFAFSSDAVTVAPFTCPSAQQTPVIVSVNFTDVTLTVTSQTGTTTAVFPDIDP